MLYTFRLRLREWWCGAWHGHDIYIAEEPDFDDVLPTGVIVCRRCGQRTYWYDLSGRFMTRMR